ncbi:hypothetical protein ACLOJK_009052 [Asimina triloba]
MTLPRRRELESEVVEQPPGVAGDNFNSTGAGLDTIADASRDCRFFRWLDDKGHSRSDIKIESRPHTESDTQQHDDIIVDFGDLVCCVDALKDSQVKEATKWKQSHMAMREEIRGLKEAALRRDLDARIMAGSLDSALWTRMKWMIAKTSEILEIQDLKIMKH